MKKPGFAIVTMLLLSVVPPLSGQSIADRLKRGITINGKPIGQPDSPARSDSARVAASQRRGDAPSVSLPTSSKAHPDVSGVILGQSTVRDVKAQLARSPAALVWKERMGALASRSDRQGESVRIPHSEYVAVVRVATKVYSTRTDHPVGTGENGTEELIRNMRDDYHCGGGADQKRGNCEDWTVRFGPNGGEPIAIAIEREVTTAPSPLGENVERSVVGKYGEPSVRLPSGSSQELIWFLKDDGSTVPPEAGRACIQPMKEAFRYIISSGSFDIGSYGVSLLRNGCFAVIDVSINAPNGVAKRVTYRALDVFSWRSSQDKTNQVIADFEQQQRDAAAKVQPPNE